MDARILLGVWGDKHIQEFLEFSLYSLLSPGNIPAFASRFNTTFVFLTKTSSIEIFDENPAYQKLKSLCKVEFIAIDDLIMSGNYSTTLTLAYDRAIKSIGEKMLETYFVFLTADYIMADGSLLGLIRYIDKGYTGICSGNYQVIEEEIRPYLTSKIDPSALTMTISPRELVKESLGHLHPISIASFYNQNIIHNYHANRFFLSYDSETLAGRFYLLHMLCIKPETMDYQIGSSCDYSFIPEMCPSGNVAIITDSDDYLVIETQPHQHELKYIGWGRPNSESRTELLAEWTTAQHRKNAETTIYYHGGILQEETRHQIDAKLASFISSIASGLNNIPAKSHRHHQYWRGAILALNEFKWIENSIQPYVFIGAPQFRNLKNRKSNFILGQSPNVYIWDYRWLGYKTMRAMIEKRLSGKMPNKVLCIYDEYEESFLSYANWLAKLGFNNHYIKLILRSDKYVAELKQQNPDLVIYFISMKQIRNLPNYLDNIKKILPPSSKVLLVVINQCNYYPSSIYDLKSEMAYKINIISNSGLKLEEIVTLHDNFTLYGSFVLRLIQFGMKHRLNRLASYIMTGVPGGIISVFRNSLSYIYKPKNEHCTGILVTLTNN